MIGKRKGYLSWDEYFMAVALLSGLRSKDPNTQVGACVANEQNKIVGVGYNGFPGAARTMSCPGRGRGRIWIPNIPMSATQNSTRF